MSKPRAGGMQAAIYARQKGIKGNQKRSSREKLSAALPNETYLDCSVAVTRF